MTMRKIFTLGLVATVALSAGCSSRGFWNQEEVLFDGIEFRRKAKMVDRQDRRAFEISIRPASASLDAAREAGKYEATSYCITNFGNSDLKWDVGPDSDALRVENDTLTFLGRCDP